VSLAERLRVRGADLRERLRGGRDPLVPPRTVELAGHADFAEAGEGLRRVLEQDAGLEATTSVLELGCGHGRLARALAGVLDGGAYTGVDADAEAVGWCRRAYAGRPGFAFVVEASERVPAEDGSHDVVVVTLVDALPGEAERRLREARRVARRAVVATGFVLDDAAWEAIGAGEAGLPFERTGDDVVLLDDAVPEEAVGFAEGWLRGQVEVRAVRHGRWRGGEAETYEDVVCG
jgi:SAM-dependent methyltransferase